MLLHQRNYQSFTGLQQEFLLDQDVTFEEVIEMKRVMEEDGSIDEEVLVEEDIIYNDIHVPGERYYQPSIEFVDPSEAFLKAKATEETPADHRKKAEEILVETKLLRRFLKKLDKPVLSPNQELCLMSLKRVQRRLKRSCGDGRFEEMANVEEELAKSKPRGKTHENKNL